MKVDKLDLELIQQVLADVAKERAFQFEKYGAQKDLNWGQRLAILAEEFGEAAQALHPLMQLTTGKESDAGDPYHELIQVAAVAVNMAEFLRGGDIGS